MSATVASPRRIAASPHARRLARERGIPLDAVAGSGPGGRIVAADIATRAPRAAAMAPPAASAAQTAALAATISLVALQQMLADFAAAQTRFSLEDVALRAAGCALDDVPAATALPGAPVALETRFDGLRAQLVFAGIRKASLGPLRRRRLAAVEAGNDQAGTAAALSLRVLDARDIRPVTMPLLPGRAMRLVLVAGGAEARCLLTFDMAAIDEERAAAVLGRFKSYLDVPIQLLA